MLFDQAQRQLTGDADVSYEKVFGIGLNKTGTTTLGDMLGQFGLRHQIWAPENFALFQKNDIAGLIQKTKLHDSFTDWPWPLIAKDLLRHYGDRACFILTRRSCAKTWIESLKGHSLATQPYNNARLAVYGYEYPHENEAAHIRMYHDHIEATRQLFCDAKQEHQLLDVCWEDGDGWGDVAKLLARPSPKTALPHHNSRRKRSTYLPFKGANLSRLGALGVH